MSNGHMLQQKSSHQGAVQLQDNRNPNGGDYQTIELYIVPHFLPRDQHKCQPMQPNLLEFDFYFLYREMK